MNKFTKIAISFLLIISIIFNPFGTVLDVRAGAIAPVIIEGIKYVIVKLLEGAAVGTLAHLTNEGIKATGEAIEEAKRIEYDSLPAIEKAVGVEISLPDSSLEDGKVYIDSFHASIIDGVELTDDERDFANYMVNYINNHPDEFKFSYDGVGDRYDMHMTASQYETIKNSVTNSYNEYVFNQIAEKQLDDSIVNMVEAGVLPTYDFSFVGPMPSISYPVTSGIGSLQKDGFVFTPCFDLDSLIFYRGRYCWPSEAVARQYLSGVDISYIDKLGDYYEAVYSYDGHCGGFYILYDDEIYYYANYSYTDNAYVHTGNIINIPTNEFLLPYAYSASGVCLADVYKEGDSYKAGVYYNKTGQVQSARPTVLFTEDEFNQTTGGGTVELPRTEAEEIIGNAIGAGLITPDSTLEIGADGAITAVDGIELAKLQEICDMLAAGNLQFENVQEYLDLISKLISTGNYTAVEQKKLLENVNANTEAIAKAITGEYELEDTDLEFNYISVEHTGFVEAHQIVDHLAIVNQSKTLLGNLFQTVESKESNNDNVPSFSFYWDSNKDGVSEEYTLLDLSFMELPLTNENLEDKGRFQNSMTVREFIHSLIVLLAYILFAIKVIKRVPVLFGGGSLGGDVSTSDVSVSNEFQRIPIDGRRW